MSMSPVELSAGSTPLGVLALRGPDTARFLQGQLAADIESLAPANSCFTGLHNPQGRVIALIALARVSHEEFLAVLPRELVSAVLQRLNRYVLRARVRLADESGNLRVLGLDSGDAGGIIPIARIEWRGRALVVADQAPGVTQDPKALAAWEGADIAAGIPQVYARTSEQFIAQMLNLDLLGGISFDKGCYTGQEIIARAHYRGRVKRRLQRWRHAGAAALAPGDSARAPDGRTLNVVRVVTDERGQELLAVGNYDPPGDPGEDANAIAGAPLVAGPLPLPYALPG
jgi:folate-binding protein YgfZ